MLRDAVSSSEFVHFAVASLTAFTVLLASLVGVYGLQPLFNPYSYLIVGLISVSGGLFDHFYRKRRKIT